MSNNPDWTKAPEGATHWDGEFGFFCDSEGFWNDVSVYIESPAPCWAKARYIPRPTEPATWNGPEDGLPPVGTRCLGQPDEKPDYCECIVIWNPPATQDGDHTSVALFDNDTTPLWCSDFRPLRTEEDKAVEEMADILNSVPNVETLDEIKRMARTLYRAGYRKENQ